MDILDWSFIGTISEEIADEDRRINKNDPLRKREYDDDCDGASTYYSPSINETEERVAAIEATAILGLTEELAEEEIKKEEVEFISLKKMGEMHNKKRKLPLRPFEQYVQDLISGKKTFKDGLD